MIKQTSLNFLTELKNNNSREWFEQNKILYQAYKDDIVQFTEQLLSEWFQSLQSGDKDRWLLVLF